MKWKCDKCGETFNLDDIPEKCPKCGEEESTFSLVD
jgi:rubrerythrin